MLTTLKHKKVAEKFVNNLFYGENTQVLIWTYVVGAHCNCLYMLLYLRNFIEIYTKQVACPLAILFSNCQ